MEIRAELCDPQLVELLALIERGHRLGQDLFDEVWNGGLHMRPAPHSQHSAIQQQLTELLARAAGLVPRLGIFNLGQAGDYRVPDGSLLRPGPDAVDPPTAAAVVEIVSPGDDTYDKLPFYAAHHVDELLIVDPRQRTVQWLGFARERYEPLEPRGLIDLGAAKLAQRIDWPA